LIGKPPEPPKNPEYGRVIKQRREEKGDSQGDLAVKMGVGRSTVANWEKGVMPPYLPDLIRYLSESPESSQPQTPPEPAADIPLTEDQTHQLRLPFESPINLEVRISPQRADTVRFAVQWMDRAAG